MNKQELSNLQIVSTGGANQQRDEEAAAEKLRCRGGEWLSTFTRIAKESEVVNFIPTIKSQTKPVDRKIRSSA